MHNIDRPKTSCNFRPPCFFPNDTCVHFYCYITRKISSTANAVMRAKNIRFLQKKQRRYVVQTTQWARRNNSQTSLWQTISRQHKTFCTMLHAERQNFLKKLPSAQNHGGNCNRGKCFYLLVRCAAACARRNYSMQMECVLFSGFSLGTTISKTPLLYFALMAFSFTSPR